MSDNSNKIIIRRFNKPSDLEFAAYLTKTEGWHSETLSAFTSFYDNDRVGCFICEIDAVPAGICIATAYQNSGFIGELIVDRQFRSQGIGRKLMQSAIKYLQERKIEVIMIDGVQKAIPFYLTLGFRPVCRSLRFFGQIDPQENPEIKNIGADDLQMIYELDRDCFGDDRSYFLKKRFENYPDVAFIWRENEKIFAYLFARIGVGGWMTVGPWVHLMENSDKITMLRHLQSKIGNQPFSIGILENRNEIIQQIVMSGLNPQSDPPSRMILGQGGNLGDNEYCLAIGSPAKG